MTFTEYLQNKRLSVATVHQYSRQVERFLAWLSQENINAEAFTYTDLLEFMRYCASSGVTKRTVHSTLCIVRHYCNYLICENKRGDNPAAGVFIKGLVRKLPTNLLTIEELEELYRAYHVQLNVGSLKKIMLGLMIYQGLRVGEILRLQVQHIKLKEGRILIKSTSRTEERLLLLHASQVTELQQYLTTHKLYEGVLFSGEAATPRSLDNGVQYMFMQLKKLNEKVINAKQIRSSVITHWLRTHSLRQVQYMAGHRYVSSTERYQAGNLEDLKNELHQHHPMK
jgi:integrase/recombinase XerD